ncbi:MAG: 1-deoxy-D-xylulose-5-phosphate reductoisomerase [Candidatus Wallbacteria bacterium]|nr:1-deoxy-D-xylulose-5-phosphate reductoisomerase [Candidatus Wallbacteria bacterium]
MKKILLLGSTGSIGKNVVNLAGMFPDHFKIVGLAVNSNTELLEEQVKMLNPQIVCITDPDKGADFARRFRGRLTVMTGDRGLEELAASSDADTLVNAVVGEVGLRPTYRALESGKDVLLANKETLVAGGHLIMPLAERMKRRIIPIDSEHSAVFQCLDGRSMDEVRRILLTASGGPFRDFDRQALLNVTREQALNHPRWKMGRKITVDSATLMNKGLEVIEAHWLFGLPYDRISVVVHPQSMIHSLVQFIDGSLLAQMGVTDMMIPISYAMAWPERLPLKHKYHLDMQTLEDLSFSRPDQDKFPCLRLAYEAGNHGGSAPVVLNSANEEAVALFLEGRLSFADIPVLIEEAVKKAVFNPAPDLDEIADISCEARIRVREAACDGRFVS